MKQIHTIERGYECEMAGPLATLPDNRVLWITQGPECPSRQVRDVVRAELRESTDNGLSWSRPRVILKGTKRAAPYIWRLLRLFSGKLLLIGTHDGGEDLQNQANSLNSGFTMSSIDNGATWSAPKDIERAERYLGPGTACAIQLSSGRIVFPFAYMTRSWGKGDVSGVYSDDEGITWQRSPSNIDIGGSGYESGAEEPSLVELPDGRLWMLIRAQSGFLWESFSPDQGATWEPARPTRLPSSNAPAGILKLSDGKIIIVWNNTVANRKSRAYARQNLVMAATRDGKDFSGFREITHTAYPTPTDIYWCDTYPFLTEAPDGTILVAFNHGNWDINQAKMARITPDWLEEKYIRDDFRDGRIDWCCIGTGAGASRMVPADDNQPGSWLEVGRYRRDGSGITRNFPLLSKGSFTLNASILKPEACLLWHNSFLLPGNYREACLRIRFAENGQVFIAAPKPKISQMNRGFAHKLSFACPTYPVKDELLYPGRIEAGRPFTLKII